jgi:hypothetical protein
MENPSTTTGTDARISDHRFSRPFDPDDALAPIDIQEGTLDLSRFVVEAEESAQQRAEVVRKRNPIGASLVEEDRVRAQAEQILGILSLARYRKGSVRLIEEGKPEFMARIEDAIRAQRPVEIILSFFCYKALNPLKTFAQTGTEVDLSEYASVLRFYEIAKAIEAVYEPGARVLVACDGTKYADAIGFTRAQGQGYYEAIRAMAEGMGLSDQVVLFDEADYYSPGIEESMAIHQRRIQDALDSGDQALRDQVGMMQRSLALYTPLPGGLSVATVGSAFSAIPDEVLAARNPEAMDLRQWILGRSWEVAVQYIAAYDAVKADGALARAGARAVRATVHPKAGQVGLYAIGESATQAFPHHIQGTFRGHSVGALGDVRVEFRVDLERENAEMQRVGGTLRGVSLSKQYPFLNAQSSHPFYFQAQ